MLQRIALSHPSIHPSIPTIYFRFSIYVLLRFSLYIQVYIPQIGTFLFVINYLIQETSHAFLWPLVPRFVLIYVFPASLFLGYLLCGSVPPLLVLLYYRSPSLEGRCPSYLSFSYSRFLVSLQIYFLYFCYNNMNAITKVDFLFVLFFPFDTFFKALMYLVSMFTKLNLPCFPIYFQWNPSVFIWKASSQNLMDIRHRSHSWERNLKWFG